MYSAVKEKDRALGTLNNERKSFRDLNNKILDDVEEVERDRNELYSELKTLRREVRRKNSISITDIDVEFFSECDDASSVPFGSTVIDERKDDAVLYAEVDAVPPLRSFSTVVDAENVDAGVDGMFSLHAMKL